MHYRIVVSMAVAIATLLAASIVISKEPPALRPDSLAASRWGNSTTSQSNVRNLASVPREITRIQGAASPNGPTPISSYPGPTRVTALVQDALAKNPEIQAARAQAQALGARVPQVGSLPDPQLMTSVFLESIQTAAGPQRVAMSLSQKLPWFGKLPLRTQVAYHHAMAAYARVEAKELEVAEKVKRAYYDVYYLQQAIAATREVEELLHYVIEVANQRSANSLPGASRQNVLQVEVELYGLKSRLVEREQAKVVAQARLAGVLHLPLGTRIEAEPSIDLSQLSETGESLAGRAEASQPTLDVRRREIRRDNSSIALAQRESWPDVTLGLNWFEMGSSGLSPVATGDDAFSLTVGVNLPIYAKRRDAAVREARYRSTASTRHYAAELDRVRSEVETLHARFVEHRKVRKILAEQILPRTEQAFELALEQYRIQGAEFQQLIDAYRKLLDHRINLHLHEAQSEQALASLERAVGEAITVSTISPLEDVGTTGGMGRDVEQLPPLK